MGNLLNIGHSGLTVSKKSLETTGHNISNVNTDGYSKQTASQTTNVPIVKNGHVTGTGARVRGVTRSHNQFVEKKLVKSTTEHNYFKERAHQLTQVEHIFNEVDNDGLNQIVNKFFNSFRELANQPENETIRSVVRDNAALVVKDFRRIRGTLDSISSNIDARLESEVEDINSILKKIASLNKKIASLETIGGESGDMRDQRDMAIRTLSESFNVHSYHDENNNFVVSAKGVGTLVAAGNIQELGVKRMTKEASANNQAGSAEIFFKSRPAYSITKKIQGGRVRSLIHARNNDIRNLQENVDNIAYNLMNSVNAIHRRGFVNREIPVDEAGRSMASVDSKGPVTGLNFFKTPTGIEGAATEIDLSIEVKTDLSNISTALSPNSPGDNRVSLAISKLQDEKVMDDGMTTIEEFYLQTVGTVGVESGKARLDEEQAEGLFVQATNLRERIAGVNLDEEAANLVKFQHAYEASAKVMQTAREMFDTVIGIKR